MSKCLNGLYCIHLELTSRCNKNCWMCGRRKIDREYPEIAANYGEMDFELVKKISEQVPEDIVVQFHNNGEPLLYPKFGEVVKLFENQIKCMDTNAKLIIERADEIIDSIVIDDETARISVANTKLLVGTNHWLDIYDISSLDSGIQKWNIY